MHVQVRVHTYIQIHTHTCIWMCTRKHECTQMQGAYTCKHTHKHTRTRTRTRARARACTRARHTHTYIHTMKETGKIYWFSKFLLKTYGLDSWVPHIPRTDNRHMCSRWSQKGCIVHHFGMAGWYRRPQLKRMSTDITKIERSTETGTCWGMHDGHVVNALKFQQK